VLSCECCKDELQSIWEKANFDPQPTQAPEPIVTKFEWRDYVVDAYHQKIGLNPPSGFCSPYRWNIHPSCSKFTTLFWYLNSPTGESVRPIFTLNTSNDAVLRKPFNCYKIKILFFIYLFEKNYSGAYGENLKIFLNCHNFGCVQDRVVIFGSRICFLGTA